MQDTPVEAPDMHIGNIWSIAPELLTFVWMPTKGVRSGSVHEEGGQSLLIDTVENF